MRFTATVRLVGLLLMIFSISMLPPALIALIYQDGAFTAFLTGFSITLLTGLLMWFPCRRKRQELKVRDGFLVVVLFWTVLSLFGAIPFYLHFYPTLPLVDAIFESVSGLTTTGATVLSHLDSMSHAILYYRQQLQLLGGMGIIVLAVAILPMLGVGGMQLYRAEMVGPIKTTKLKPRMAETAKSLWYIYGGLVLVCALLYWIAGLNLFEAIGESFSTVATGGFSMHDTSIAYYHNAKVDVVAIVFMLLSAINYGLHFQFLRHRRVSVYTRDPELRTYVGIILTALVIVTVALIYYQHFQHPGRVLHAIFTVVSIATTCGLTTTTFSLWPTFLPVFLMFVAILGGCGASTSGGIKVMRCLILKELGKRELKRLVHPYGVFSVKLGDDLLPTHIMTAVWGFISVFIFLFIVLFLFCLAVGLDTRTAFGAVAACLSNTGASIGLVSHGYANIPDACKWALLLAMLAGRLEIFTLFVLLMPSYWRK